VSSCELKIFGSKTGYGKIDLILQPSQLQVCSEIDVRAPPKKLINIATVRAEPADAPSQQNLPPRIAET
jgi:hypothetical protein